MYSFLVKEVPVSVSLEPEYQWFTYHGRSPVLIKFQGKSLAIGKGKRFGVRPSTSGTEIRLVFPEDKSKVLTISREQAESLAKGVK